jgi:hypothetical protein
MEAGLAETGSLPGIGRARMDNRAWPWCAGDVRTGVCGRLAVARQRLGFAAGSPPMAPRSTWAAGTHPRSVRSLPTPGLNLNLAPMSTSRSVVLAASVVGWHGSRHRDGACLLLCRLRHGVLVAEDRHYGQQAWQCPAAWPSVEGIPGNRSKNSTVPPNST